MKPNLAYLKSTYYRMASEAYRKSDDAQWICALACSRVVGNYEKGSTLGLANDMGVSSDTIEDLAHAYWLFEKLCSLDNGKFRLFVFQARRSTYIYISHFRALYDAQRFYGLTDTQVLDLLNDIIQNEGQISSRGVDSHTRSRFGDTRGWSYYGTRTKRELEQTLQQPDFPSDPSSAGYIYSVTVSINGNKHGMLVIATTPQRAEYIARKILSNKIDMELVKKSKCTCQQLGQATTDSRHLLKLAFEWLENNTKDGRNEK